MTYDPNQPVASDDMSESVTPLATNFTQLNTVFGNDHYAFDDTTAANRGRHQQVTFVEQGAEPDAPLTDELRMFAKDSGGQPEIFVKESSGTSYQFTKAGSIYTGLLPFASVNFDTTLMTYGTTLGVTSVTSPASGKYQINFTNTQSDNDYFWTVSGFNSGSNAVIGQPANSGVYSDVVNVDYIIVEFRNPGSSTRLTNLTRMSVTCWRFQ